MKVLLSWSSGKDSAWALHVLRTRGHEVEGLFTTVRESGRVAIHDVRPEVLAAQAEAVGLPLHVASIPDPCPNEIYEQVMSRAMAAAKARGVTHVAFGDLFLEDIRAYREAKLAGTGITPLFPLWGEETSTLARTMVERGARAVVVTVDPRRVDRALCGRTFDGAFLDALPPEVDPCAERGEFHTLAIAGPAFARPLDVVVGNTMERDAFVHVDVRLRS